MTNFFKAKNFQCKKNLQHMSKIYTFYDKL